MAWQTWAFIISISISIICKLGIAILEADKPHQSARLNRQARRHPNGKVPAQKFQRVNAVKQKQGNNRAIKGW